MKIKINKLHEDAKMPTYGTAGSACFDLYASGVYNRFVSHVEVIGTGLAFEIPEGYVMLVYSRSGHGFKNNVRLANCVGVIDSDYRGEVKVKLICDNRNSTRLEIETGDRIAQAMIVPVNQVDFEFVDELSTTDRGTGGFGSTGT